jgi:hypothetical protein
MVLLEKVELSDILPHCLGVLHKIDEHMGLDHFFITQWKVFKVSIQMQGIVKCDSGE